MAQKCTTANKQDFMRCDSAFCLRLMVNNWVNRVKTILPRMEGKNLYMESRVEVETVCHLVAIYAPEV